MTGERAPRCRYVRRDGNPCSNPIAGQGDEEVLLCVKHSQEAYKVWRELVRAKLGDRADAVLASLP